jgi:ABC-type transport system substrate-binding protein
MPGFSAQTKQRDLQEAKRLLTEAGHPNGFSMELMYRPSLSSSNAIAEPLASAWKTDLGIQVTLKPMESAAFEAARRDGAYEAVLTTTGDKPIETFYEYYYSKGFYAKYGLNDPELDRMITAAQTENDEGKRIELGRELQKYVLDKVYAIHTVERQSFAVWQPWIQNYLYNPGGQVIPFYTPAITWIDLTTAPEHRKNEKLPF